jgi:hypothetical protein
MAALITENLPAGDVRAIELCGGPHSLRRWEEVAAQRGEGRLNVSLTDFDSVLAGAPSQSLGERSRHKGRLSVGTETMDLTKSLKSRPDAERFDVAVCTYGFDSVWLPGDRYLILSSGDWYEGLFRVAVPDWHPHSQAIKRAFATGDCSGVQPKDFRQLIIERTVRAFDSEAEPGLATLLAERVAGIPDRNGLEAAKFWYPGGLVTWLERAFDTIIKPGGVVVIGDTGTYDPTVAKVGHLMLAGTGARFKGLDFWLAERMLTARGFEVTVKPVAEVVRSHFGSAVESWHPAYERDCLEIPYQYVMAVKRAGAVAQSDRV